jgi:hypothetical protein
MGVPQITTITPSEGLSSGRGKVVIRGSLFRVQESDPDAEVPSPTVSVTFNGVAAETVLPIAHYRLDVVTPRFLGDPESLPDAVDVVVTNLDDAGDPIPGETVTKTDGFTYRRPDIVQTAPDGTPTLFSTLQAINETFLQMLRRDLTLEVAPATDPDWSDDPPSGLTAVGSLPALLVDGPAVEESLDYRSSNYVETNTDDADESVSITAAPFTAKLSWSIVIVSDRKHDAVHALNAVIALFRRRPAFDVPVKAGSSETYSSDLTFEEWSTDDQPQTQIYTYSTTVTVEPVYLTDDYGYAADGVPVGEVTVHATEDSDEFLQLEVEPK